MIAIKAARLCRVIRTLASLFGGTHQELQRRTWQVLCLFVWLLEKTRLISAKVIVSIFEALQVDEYFTEAILTRLHSLVETWDRHRIFSVRIIKSTCHQLQLRVSPQNLRMIHCDAAWTLRLPGGAILCRLRHSPMALNIVGILGIWRRICHPCLTGLMKGLSVGVSQIRPDHKPEGGTQTVTSDEGVPSPPGSPGNCDNTGLENYREVS